MEQSRPATLTFNQLLTEKEAAPLLGVNVKTLQNWRWRGTGPAYIKASAKHVRYRMSDLNEYLEKHIVKPTFQ